MSTNTVNAVAQVMRDRASVKKYQPGKQIPEETLNEILELATTAPSSWNLQHWRFLVVQEQERKEKLLPIAYNQQQVADCSAVVIVLGDVEANKVADEVYTEAVEAGFMPQDVKDTLVGQINGAYEKVENIGVHEAIRNGSLGAMQLMLAAKAHGLDTCPMGGFNPVALREELNIPDRYTPVMMITVGYPAEPAHPSKRFPLDKVVINETF